MSDIRNIINKLDELGELPQEGDILQLECGDTLIEAEIQKVLPDSVLVFLDETAIQMIGEARQRFLIENSVNGMKIAESLDDVFEQDGSYKEVRGNFDPSSPDAKATIYEILRDWGFSNPEKLNIRIGEEPITKFQDLINLGMPAIKARQREEEELRQQGKPRKDNTVEIMMNRAISKPIFVYKREDEDHFRSIQSRDLVHQGQAGSVAMYDLAGKNIVPVVVLDRSENIRENYEMSENINMNDRDTRAAIEWFQGEVDNLQSHERGFSDEIFNKISLYGDPERRERWKKIISNWLEQQSQNPMGTTNNRFQFRQDMRSNQDVTEGSGAVCPSCHSADIKTYSDGEKECNHCHKTWDVQGVAEGTLTEAEYQGRKVTLNKPMAGDSKKFKVYVKNKKGNVVKVNFGQKGVKIKKSNPARRKSFRARHNCATAKDKTTARYWSCRKW